MDTDIAAARAALAAADDRKVKSLSAELNGLLSLFEEIGDLTRGGIHHLLIATDTYAGQATARIVDEWLIARGHGTDLRVPTDLRTADLGEFRAALAGLVKELLPTIEDYQSKGFEVIFNLTGGFKGIPGFLQTVASICGAQSIYVFEGSRALLRIPRLPIRLDGTSAVGANLALFRRLAASVDVAEAEARAAGIPETLLFEFDGKVVLSEWGTLVWEAAWREIAAKSLLQPRTSRVRFSPRFERDAGKLGPIELYDVNTAIEALQRRLEGNLAGQLSSFEFKMLRGHPKRPATHELYAWSRGSAGRIFLYDDAGTWIANEIGVHLP